MKYKDQMKKMRDGPSKVCLEIGSGLVCLYQLILTVVEV